MDRLLVDRAAFEKLVVAVVVDGDLAHALAAIDEIKLVHGHNEAGHIIAKARKKKRGIADQERAPFVLPVAGHLLGSTIGEPRLKDGDPVPPLYREAVAAA